MGQMCTTPNSTSLTSSFPTSAPLDSSVHDSRSNYVWIRNEDISAVYEVESELGLGSMGAVSVVRKRRDGNKSLRRINSDGNTKAIGERKEEEEGERPLPSLSTLPPSLHLTRKNSNSSSASNTINIDLDKLSRKFACKTVALANMKKEEIEEFENEIEILRDLDHPNIVQLFECFRVKRKMWLVMELCNGGDLTTRILTEYQACKVVSQMLLALSYMHGRGICHRDLKLENVMYTSSDPSSIEIKLIDFGLSEKYNKNEKMTKACGTVYTAAPEVITGKSYTTQTDIWSLGVCTYVLLSTDFPFLRDHDELRDKAKLERLINAKYTFRTERWGRISKGGREFVAFGLRKHPGARWTAKEALIHINKKWMVLFNDAGVLIDAGKSNASPGSIRSGRKRINSVMLRSFEDFGSYGEMKKKILMTMAHTMDKGGLKELADMFQSIDVNNEGTITLVELRDALKEKRDIDEEKIEKIFKGIDYDHSGQIHYKEFLAAAMESQGLVTQERLLEAFDRMDSDNSGRISKKNLKELLGRDYDEELVKKMLGGEEGGGGGEGGGEDKEGIDYEAFLELMFEEKGGTKVDDVKVKL